MSQQATNEFLGDNPKEVLEVFTKEGKPTGVGKNRTLVHLHGDYHQIVHVWVINNKGELLLQKRAPWKKAFPNKWDVSSAGHISMGEVPREAAIKELHEELGIEAKEDELEQIFALIPVFKKHSEEYTDNEFANVFLLQRPQMHDTSQLKLQETEVTDAKWVHFVHVEQLFKQHDERLAASTAPGYFAFFDMLRGGKYPVLNDVLPSDVL